MKYESDILEMIHENATIDFQLGLISEAAMREYDELCLAHETVTSEPLVHKPLIRKHTELVSV